jgi:NADH:ubiquinone oxidoreductase subunit D
MADIKNYTLNFGPQHPAAHGVLRFGNRRVHQHRIVPHLHRQQGIGWRANASIYYQKYLG